MKRSLIHSFRMQMMLYVLGAIFLLILSTAYILYSTVKMQEVMTSSFEQERYINSIQAKLESFQPPFVEFLSSRSSNALAALLIESQNLRAMIPSVRPLTRNPIELREREFYSMIDAYLGLADTIIEEKRGRNISGYTSLYDEMTILLGRINREAEKLSRERFLSQMQEYEIFIGNARNIQIWNLLFIVFVSIFALLTLLLSIRKMSDPMIRLSAMASELSEGNFEIEDIGRSSIQEIDHVVDAFNKMKTDIHSYVEELKWQKQVEEEYMQEKMRNLKMEKLVHRMEIYTLQAQMNPHFLFNTLNTGMQLAIVEDADRTSEYMEMLSKLFRHNIRNKEIIVPLRHEIEGLKYFFYILKVRFPRTLDLDLVVSEELLDSCLIPVSLLQPLVENSIVHAFKDQTETCKLSVLARKENPYLVLTVEDNGRGMPGKTREMLLHPQPFNESPARVMGLENVIQRLHFFYPNENEVIQIDSTVGKGTKITIKINLEKKACIEY